MREAGAPNTGNKVRNVLKEGPVPAPPGAHMVAPPTTLCNTERAHSEGRAGMRWEGAANDTPYSSGARPSARLRRGRSGPRRWG